jgi:hypothetical protein
VGDAVDSGHGGVGGSDRQRVSCVVADDSAQREAEHGDQRHRPHARELPGGGYIEPVTASARSRLGQRITFVVQDETHSWVQTNGGLQLADNQRRNLAGMSGRFLETTNAFDPVEGSVAQRTFESKAPGTLFDDAEPPSGSVRNKRERRKVLQHVYGDSWWVDLDRIDQEIEALLEHDPAQAERFFLNRKLASEGAAFDIEAWKNAAARRKVPAHADIVLGVDGARHHDAIAVVATEIKSGYQWPVIILERPSMQTTTMSMTSTRLMARSRTCSSGSTCGAPIATRIGSKG